MIIKDSKTYTETPYELCKKLGVKNEMPDFVTYNKDVDWQYHVIRSSTHDGTLLFFFDIIVEALNAILSKETCFVGAASDAKDAIDIKYTIGDVEITHEWGSIEDEVSRDSAKWKNWYALCQRDKVSIPVRCEYVYDEKLKEVSL